MSRFFCEVSIYFHACQYLKKALDVAYAVEATCKSLVSQRLKRSGMSWQLNGGQSILTLRSIVKSQRFDAVCSSISNRYKSEVIGHSNVINLFG